MGVELKRFRRNNQAESATPRAGGFEAYAFIPEPEQSIEVVCIDRPTIAPGYRGDRAFTTKPFFFAWKLKKTIFYSHGPCGRLERMRIGFTVMGGWWPGARLQAASPFGGDEPSTLCQWPKL